MRSSRLGLLPQYAIQRLDLKLDLLCWPYPTILQLKKMVKVALLPAVRQATISLVVTNEKKSQELNKRWRNKNYPTNILSFPLGTVSFEHQAFDERHVVGDLVLCAPLISREALQYRQSIIAYYALLVIHGLLHLQGYDHENDHAHAKLMYGCEKKMLAKLGYRHPQGWMG